MISASASPTEDAFPERAPRRKRPSILDPHRAYLTQRGQEGCHNGAPLLRELRERGYTGGQSIVADAVRALRTATRGVEHDAVADVRERS